MEVELQEVRRFNYVNAEVATSCQDVTEGIVTGYFWSISTLDEFDRADYGVRIGFSLSLKLLKSESVISDISTALLCLEDCVGQIGNITEAKIETLASQWVDSSRSIADQGHPVASKLLRYLKGQWEGEPLCVDC